MKKYLPVFFVLLQIPLGAMIAIAQPIDPPIVKPKVVTPLVPLTMTAKGGELLVIDASKASAAVLFDFDATVFDAKHATIDGKKLYLAIPRNDSTQTYAITVIADMPLSKDRVTITVPGDVTPTPPDPPVDPLAKLKSDVAAILASQTSMQATVAQNSKDIAALQQIKPIPPPVEPFQAAVQAAYVADGKPAAAAASLAAVYRQSGPTVNNATFTKTSDILGAMHTAAQTLIADQLPTVRRVIGDELNTQLGKADVPLTAVNRAAISAQFLRAQKALESVQSQGGK
jgi:hypothetical protein